MPGRKVGGVVGAGVVTGVPFGLVTGLPPGVVTGIPVAVVGDPGLDVADRDAVVAEPGGTVGIVVGNTVVED